MVLAGDKLPDATFKHIDSTGSMTEITTKDLAGVSVVCVRGGRGVASGGSKKRRDSMDDLAGLA